VGTTVPVLCWTLSTVQGIINVFDISEVGSKPVFLLNGLSLDRVFTVAFDPRCYHSSYNNK
jgi:hypothetical protein